MHHDCCRPHEGHHGGHHGMSHHGGGCCDDSGCGCGSGRSWRRFVSKAEKRKMLEQYLKELEEELIAVKELLKEIK